MGDSSCVESKPPPSEVDWGTFCRTGTPREVFVDPEVSKAKFRRELQEYSKIAAERRQLGWWVLSVEFPELLVAFVSPGLRPAAVLFGALLDFTNYDTWPVSITIVDPFSGKPLRYRDIPDALRMHRRVNEASVDLPGFGKIKKAEDQPLLVAHGPDEIPFLCIPGVREYHDHPAHTSDQWLEHRGRGEGSLFFLLEKLYKYGVEPIKGYQLGLHISGFARGEPPE